jgi:hypothetical protein
MSHLRLLFRARHRRRAEQQMPAGALATERALNQSVNPSDVAKQLVWDGVAGSEVIDTGIVHPYTTIATLPNKDFEWQVQSQEGRSNHQWSASFRIAKDQHMSLPHHEPDTFGFLATIDVRKYVEVLAVYCFLQAPKGLSYREWAECCNNTCY